MNFLIIFRFVYIIPSNIEPDNIKFQYFLNQF